MDEDADGLPKGGDPAPDSIDPRHKSLVAWLNRMRNDSGLASPIIWRTPRPEDDLILELFPFILGRPSQETNDVQYFVEECSLLIGDRAVKSLISLLESPDKAASRNAAGVLKRLGRAAYHAIPDLKKLVAEKKGVIQEQCRAILKRIEQAVPLADLSAEDPHLRVNAAELLCGAVVSARLSCRD